MAKRKIEVEIIGDASSLAKAFGRGGRDADAFGRKVKGTQVNVSKSMSGIVGSAAKLGAVTVGIGGVVAGLSKIGKATIEFDKGMRNVNSIAQLSEKDLGKLNKEVLKLAGKTAQAPKTLADGLYDLVSSGFKSKDAMLILSSSAKAATAGLTDTGTSTKAVAAVLNAYHRPAKDAANISDTLFQTVNRGVISFEDLSTTIGDVLPTAASLGVDIGQVGASIATMTKQGISAPETITKLRGAMTAFIKPSKGMAAAIKATGAESGAALIKSKGFQGALQEVLKTTDGTQSSVAKLFPDVRAMQGAFALTGKNARSAAGDLTAFKDVTGATEKALSQQSKSISYQWNQIKAVVTSVAIQFGSLLIPVVTKGFKAVGGFISQMKAGTGVAGQIRSTATAAFDAIRNAVQGAAGRVKDLVKGFKDSKGWAVALVAVVAGMTTGFAAYKTVVIGIRAATAAWGIAQGAVNVVMSLNPIGLTIAALVALGVGLTIAYKKSATFRNVVQGAFKGVKAAGKWLEAAGKDIAQWVSNAVGNMRRFASGVGKWMSNAVGNVRDFASGVGKWISNAASNVRRFPGKVLGYFKSLPGKLLNAGKDMVQGLIDGIRSKAGEIVSTIKETITDKIPGFLKKAMDMHSPSRVMRALGMNIAEGLAQGVAAGKGFVESGLNTGLLYPLDAKIAEIEAKKTALQASFDNWDSKRARQALVSTAASARRAMNAPGSSAGGGDGGSVGSRVGGSVGGDVLGWAKSKLGHFAESAGSNVGKELDGLQKQFGMRAEAWCAMFATMAADMGGASKSVRTASVATMRQWANEGSHGYAKGVKKTGRAGDMMMFKNNHVEFVEKIVNGVTHTIAGNTSAGKVIRRTHKEGDGDYARPIYAKASGGSVTGSVRGSAASVKQSGGSSLLTKGQKQFGAHLASATGLSPKTVGAWMLAEMSGGAATRRQKDKNHNWLNIGYDDHLKGKGKFQGRSVWDDPKTAARMSADFLKGNKLGASASIKAILKTAGKGPNAQLAAIAGSNWASSHYFGGKSLRGAMKSLGANPLGKITGSSAGGSDSGVVAANRQAEQAQKQMDRNTDKMAELRRQSRALGNKKESAARRKELAEEVADLQDQNRKLARTKRDAKKQSAEAKRGGAKGQEYRDALKAIKDFDTLAGRSEKQARLDMEQAGYVRLKGFKDAVEGIRTSIKDRLNTAVDSFRDKWEKTVGAARDAAFQAMVKGFDADTTAALRTFDKTTDGIVKAFDRQTAAMVATTDAAKLLAQMRSDDATATRAKEDEKNAEDLAAAKKLAKNSGGQAHIDALEALADVEAQIAATERSRVETELEATVAAETAAIEEARAAERAAADERRGDERAGWEEARANERKALEDAEAASRTVAVDAAVEQFRAAEQAKLDTLTEALDAGKLKYAAYVKAVNGMLGRIGGGALDTSADAESTINAGPTASKEAPKKGSKWDWGDGKGFVHTKPRFDWGDGKGFAHTIGRAVGGGMEPGRDYRVGELGPETVRVASPAVATQASQGRGTGGSGGNVYITNATFTSGRQAEIMAHKLSHRLRYG